MNNKLTYNYEDIMKIMQVSRNTAYSIIRNLRKTFVKDYPGTITIQGRIPVNYFNEKYLGIKKEKNPDKSLLPK